MAKHIANKMGIFIEINGSIKDLKLIFVRVNFLLIFFWFSLPKTDSIE